MLWRRSNSSKTAGITGHSTRGRRRNLLAAWVVPSGGLKEQHDRPVNEGCRTYCPIDNPQIVNRLSFLTPCVVTMRFGRKPWLISRLAPGLFATN